MSPRPKFKFKWPEKLLTVALAFYLMGGPSTFFHPENETINKIEAKFKTLFE